MLKLGKIKKVNNVSVLIISDNHDYTTDYVCIELEKRSVSYLRLDRNRFNTYRVQLDIHNMKLVVIKNRIPFEIDEKSLQAVYYRAPTYLRETYSNASSAEEQLYASQWMAFVRNLTIFEKSIWMNNPIATYKAENKLLQLKYAVQIGFQIPQTDVVNYWQQSCQSKKKYLIKSLDTVLLKIGSQEGFVYSNIVSEEELCECDLSLAPVIIQNYLKNKIDIRVTVVGDLVYSVEITKNGKGVEGDWRKYKTSVAFTPVSLPREVELKCIDIVKRLGLVLGCIDLIKVNNDYFFIEVNPTGEWAWLVDSSNLLIYEGICDILLDH